MKSVVAALKFTGLSSEKLESLIEFPREKSHGDYAFPCFSLAKTWKKNPVEIARELAVKIGTPRGFEKVAAVGPYVNFFVDARGLAEEVLKSIEKEKKRYGSTKEGNRKTFMIEFSQPNTHKAFHVGHIRGTSLGESIA